MYGHDIGALRVFTGQTQVFHQTANQGDVWHKMDNLKLDSSSDRVSSKSYTHILLVFPEVVQFLGVIDCSNNSRCYGDALAPCPTLRRMELIRTLLFTFTLCYCSPFFLSWHSRPSLAGAAGLTPLLMTSPLLSAAPEFKLFGSHNNLHLHDRRERTEQEQDDRSVNWYTARPDFFTNNASKVVEQGSQQFSNTSTWFSLRHKVLNGNFTPLPQQQFYSVINQNVEEVFLNFMNSCQLIMIAVQLLNSSRSNIFLATYLFVAKDSRPKFNLILVYCMPFFFHQRVQLMNYQKANKGRERIHMAVDSIF